jgi:hypothetical protein
MATMTSHGKLKSTERTVGDHRALFWRGTGKERLAALWHPKQLGIPKEIKSTLKIRKREYYKALRPFM